MIMIVILLKITAINVIKRKKENKKDKNKSKFNIAMELMSLSILKYTKLLKMGVQDVTD